MCRARAGSRHPVRWFRSGANLWSRACSSGQGGQPLDERGVLSDQGSGPWSCKYSVLDWLATGSTRPAVASMSLGGPGTQQAMADAVDAGVNSGVVVVVAGGKSNSDACWFSPAVVPSAVTVGSTTCTDARSSFSGYDAYTYFGHPAATLCQHLIHRSPAAAASVEHP